MGSKKILIADDNPAMQQTLKDLLRDRGFDVNLAKDGYEALSILKNNPPDLLILDVVMPGKDGLSVFSTIKNLYPKTKVVIYTAHEKYKDTIYSRLAHKFLIKGEDVRQLLETVEELLGS
jgi:two-component system nitrogen regulation response regulator GlnG